MRITRLKTKEVILPLEAPLRTAIHEIADVCCLLVTLETDTGLTGEGYGFCFQPERLRSLNQFVQSLAPMIEGRDPHHVEAIWGDMLRALNFYGQAGVAVLAMNPIDIALWDIIGKASNQPLYRIFGAQTDRVPVYASGGLWLSTPASGLGAEAADFMKQGFKAMKLRLGSRRWQDDIARVEAVREVIGPDFALMADANQSLDARHALKLGRELERFNLVWFEEPVPTWNDTGHRALSEALDVPLASGESEYTVRGIRRILEQGRVDIMMPDLQRMGGYTEMRRAAQYLAAMEIPVSPHIFTEHSLHIVASIPNGFYAEHMPWFAPLFNEKMALDAEGMVALPQGPGVGFTFNHNQIDRHVVA